MNRRNFIENSVLATLGITALPHLTYADKLDKAGIQLYTLRDVINKDLRMTLETLSRFGYNYLETYTQKDKGYFFGEKTYDFMQMTNDLGLKIISSHAPYSSSKDNQYNLKYNGAKVFNELRRTKQKYVVIPYLDNSLRASIDSYKRVCEDLNKLGELANTLGLKLGYHNHAFEFEKIDGQIPYDVMLQETDPDKVFFEMDLYWVVTGGQKPIEYFSKHPGRFKLWHIKDKAKSEKGETCEIGNGMIDFKSILALKDKAGLEFGIVEQEQYNNTNNSIKSAEICINNLKKINF